MDLFDIITNKKELKKTKENHSSIIKNLAKIKYHELPIVLDDFDNEIMLMQYVGGWLPLHYCTLNNDYRILKTISELYIKHNLSLDFHILNNKNSCSIGFTSLDIAVQNAYIPHYIILKKYGATALADFSEIFLAKKFNYQKKKIDNLKVSNDDNILLRFFANDKSNIAFFLKENYFNKEKIISDFLFSMEEIQQQTPLIEWEYCRHLSSMAQELYKSYQKEIYPLELISSLFFQPMEYAINQIYEQVEEKDFSAFKNNNILGVFLSSIGEDVNNYNISNSIFFDILNDDLFERVLKTTNKFNKIKEVSNPDKSLIKFFDAFEPLCRHYQLENMIKNKEVIKKKKKL